MKISPASTSIDCNCKFQFQGYLDLDSSNCSTELANPNPTKTSTSESPVTAATTIQEVLLSTQIQSWILNQKNYSVEKSVLTKEECEEWLPYANDSEPDPYLDVAVHKRMSTVTLNSMNGRVEKLPAVAVTQSKKYDDNR